MVTVSRALAEPPLILAVDLGTSSTKALVYDRSGRAVEGLVGRRGYDAATTSDDGASFDADRLFVLVADLLDELEGRIAGLTIQAIAFSTFWHSLVGLDAGGDPVTPLFTWADTRSAPSVRLLRRRLDERAIHDRTGCRFHPSYSPAKLLWLARTDPKVFRRCRHWLTVGDFVLFRLTGSLTTGISMASGTGLFDGQALDWDDEVLGAVGVGRDRLPEVNEHHPLANGLRDEWARRWPSLRDAHLFPAVGDGVGGSIGSGCTSPDRASIMIGTSGAFRQIVPASTDPVPWGLFRYRLDQARSVLGGALSAGGNLFAWIVEHLRVGSFDELEAEIATLPPDGHGLTVLPFLAGERSPGWRPNATGVITGLTMATTAAEIGQAVLEAVAYRFAIVAEEAGTAVPDEAQIVASGGGLVRSPLWTQIIADVIGRPITMSTETESSSRGVALFALEALGAIANLGSLPASFGRTFEPDPARHDRYQAGLARHRALYRRIGRVRG